MTPAEMAKIRTTCASIIMKERALMAVVHELSEFIERVRKHPFYEMTKDDRRMLMAIMAILLTMNDILHGDTDEA